MSGPDFLSLGIPKSQLDVGIFVQTLEIDANISPTVGARDGNHEVVAHHGRAAPDCAGGTEVAWAPNLRYSVPAATAAPS